MNFATRTQNLVQASWWTDAVSEVDRRMDQDGGHDHAHIERVLVNAHTIWQGELEAGRKADWEAIAAAVLFHDVVNLPKDHPERHLASSKSADVATGYLNRFLTSEQLEVVHEAIRTHSYSSGLSPSSLEAMIVTDADRLEAVGAFGIARTFYVSGALKGSIVSMDEPFGGERELDDAEYAIDHFFRKLLFVSDLMHTDTGKRLADQRHAYLIGFIDQMAQELGVASPNLST